MFNFSTLVKVIGLRIFEVLGSERHPGTGEVRRVVRSCEEVRGGARRCDLTSQTVLTVRAEQSRCRADVEQMLSRA